MRNLLATGAFLLLPLILACGGDTAPTGGDAKRFHVALLTPGSVADGGWNQGAYEGLQRIGSELDAEISHQETKTPAEFEDGFRAYARAGADLVFGHGFEYQEAAARVGAAFPNTIFITTSGNTLRPNVAPMVFELEQATYLCGALAAHMSASGKLGLVGGIDLPSIRSTFQAFRAGAVEVRPDISVKEVFTGNFSDVAAAREAALALLEEGADFLMHQANDAGRGVFRAAQDRAAAGARVFVFGTNKNQNAMAPKVVLASATLDIPAALVEVARRVKAGNFEPEPMRLGMEEGIVRLEFNAELQHRIEPRWRDAVSQLELQIRSGERVVPRGDF